MVRGPLAYRYALDVGSVADAQRQPPVQRQARLGHIGQPVAHVAHELQLSGQRPRKQHLRHADRRERLQHHRQRLDGTQPRIQHIGGIDLPGPSGQGRTYAYPRRQHQLLRQRRQRHIQPLEYRDSGRHRRRRHGGLPAPAALPLHDGTVVDTLAARQHDLHGTHSQIRTGIDAVQFLIQRTGPRQQDIHSQRLVVSTPRTASARAYVTRRTERP